MKLKNFLIAGILLVTFGAARTPSDVQEVNWLTFEEMLELHKNEPRKIVVDMYTDWCGWCKKLDREVYANPGIVEYLNENYYSVKFNTEKFKENIDFAGHTFKFIPPPQGGRNGVHELAYALMDGGASYPTTVFIDENLQPIQALPGYHDAKFFDAVFTFIGEDHYRSIAWSDYEKNHKSNL